MLKDAKRILVLGCSGSGKSTLTRWLCEKYKLPPVHMDVYFWKAGWRETPKNEWREKVKDLVKKDSWVMDGTFSESFDLRFPVADKIILINLPRSICLYRAIKRVFEYSKVKRRSDMALGCDETFDLHFYKYIWTYNKRVLPKIYEGITQYKCENKIIVLSSRKEVLDFKKQL